MKISHWIILLFFLFSVPSYAVDNPVCDGVTPIVVDRNDRVHPMTPAKFQNLFTQNYQNYSCLNNSAYCLCFDYRSDFPTNALTLSLDSTIGNKPVYIVGLQINGLTGPLVIKGSQPVTLINTHFACTNRNKDVGIQLNSEGHQIQNSEIQNCSVGIQVGDAQNVANSNIIGPANKIHDNNTGVKIANGSGNFVKQNIIYKNDANGDGTFEQTEGIFIADGANADDTKHSILPPEILNRSGTLVSKYDEPILTYPPNIPGLPPDDQPPIIATFQIKPPYPAGKVEVDLIDYNLYGSNSDENKKFRQGNQFFTDVNCIISESQYTCQVPMTKGKKDQPALILFHDPVFGSTTYSQRVVLNGPGPFTPPVSGSAPTTGGMTGGGNFGASTDGGSSASLPEAGGTASSGTTSAIPVSSATTGGGDGGGGSGAVTVAGAGGGGGGMGSCGANLNQTNHSTVSGILLLEVTALLLLVLWRRKRRQSKC